MLPHIGLSHGLIVAVAGGVQELVPDKSTRVLGFHMPVPLLLRVKAKREAHALFLGAFPRMPVRLFVQDEVARSRKLLVAGAANMRIVMPNVRHEQLHSAKFLKSC